MAPSVRPRSISFPACTFRLQVSIFLGVLLLMASVTAAQVSRGGPGWRGGLGLGAATFATSADFDGGFQFCRIVFRNARDGAGDGWNVDWPRADENLSIRLSELTRVAVSMDGNRQPKHLLVRLDAPELLRCPFVMMTEPGGAFFDHRRRRD